MVLEYEQLSFNEKKHYDKIHQAMLNGDGTVTLLGIFNMHALEKIVVALKYDHAELFYVDFQRINCTVLPVGMIYYIYYTVRPDIRDMVTKNMEKWIAHALIQMQLKGNETEADIYRKVHNYLIRNVEYDYDALYNPEAYPESFTVRGIFEQNKAVCEGISKAFKLLCYRAGAKNVYVVEGKSSHEGFGDSIPHAWNIVKTGKEFSHVDVTWDLGSSKSCKYNRYDYFMIPDEWIMKDHEFVSNLNCYTSNQSYFVRRKCLIEDSNSLKMFLDQEFQKKVSVLYFKIVGKNGLPSDIDNRIQSLVQKKILQYALRGYSVKMAPNQAQHIFFYKIDYL